MLSEVLPNTTIVSIGHRSTLIALHRRHIEMEPGQAGIFEPTPTTKVGPSRGRAAMDFR
jgi:vitamin B12/bleomycin/antimicrobial peptide transport system ATP-binding/permease protein